MLLSVGSQNTGSDNIRISHETSVVSLPSLSLIIVVLCIAEISTVISAIPESNLELWLLQSVRP